jgi:peptidoglycan/xylan/chitin deacetylase (PgdA/CDA1 family)
VLAFARRTAYRVRRRLRRGSAAVILCYHRLAEPSFDPWSLCVTPEHFAQHLEHLSRVAQPVPLAEIQSTTVRRRPLVAVTFDDGYADNVLAGSPLLQRHGVAATIFLTTGFVDSERELWWDELERALFEPRRLPHTLELLVDGGAVRRAARSEAEERAALYHDLYDVIKPLEPANRSRILADLLAWAGVDSTPRETHRGLAASEIEGAARDRLVTFGAHTRRHPVLAAVDPQMQRDEIAGSKSDVEGLTAAPVTSFAYPHGRAIDYTPETVEIVRSSGFQLACTTVPGPVSGESDSLQLARICVADMDGATFRSAFDEWTR